MGPHFSILALLMDAAHSQLTARVPGAWMPVKGGKGRCVLSEASIIGLHRLLHLAMYLLVIAHGASLEDGGKRLALPQRGPSYSPLLRNGGQDQALVPDGSCTSA